jgi:uncharacterized SAM-binding protein YcdF (DUF218 family)
MSASEQPDVPAIGLPARWLRRFRLLGLVAGCVAGGGVLIWVEHAAMLREAAALWIVSDPPMRADAVAVLGGGLEYRPFAAVDFYRRGLAAKVLVSNVAPSRAEQLGVLQSHAKANVAVLSKLGIPATAIEVFGDQLTDTYSEAHALHDWALRTGARTIIVPTDIFAARRLSWTLHRVFGADVNALVPAIDPLEYDRNDWWKNEYGVIAFQNEVVKYFYYRIKY